MSTLADIAQINGQINTDINSMVSQANTYAQDAAAYARGEAWMGPLADVAFVDPNIKPFDTNQDFGAEYLATYQGLLDQIGPEFDALFNNFMNTYFPKQLLADVEAWLSDVINNGYKGIPDSHYEAIWQRARDKEMREVSRLTDDSLSAFSSRGWSIPAGALASRLYTIQQEANAKLASINRDIAIKDVEVQVDMVKFAISEAAALAKSMWGIMLDYLNKYLSMYGIAGDKGNSLVNAKRGLYDSMYRYYQLVMEAERMRIGVDEWNLDKDKELMKTDVDSFHRTFASQVSAANNAFHSFASIAQGMATSRNTLSSQGHNTSATG